MKIGEFAKLVGLSVPTLRYYEERGFLHVDRVNGIRNYTAGDVRFVQFIKRLKDMGMPLADIRRYADLRYAGESTVEERKALLREHEQYIDTQLAVFSEYKENLMRKIAFYDEILRRKAGKARGKGNRLGDRL